MSVNAIGPAPLPERSEPVALALGPYMAPRADANAPAKVPVTAFEKADGPSFSDLIDVINPLQHIPLVNIVYQKLTGDTEGAIADVVGGAIYGGFIGLGAAVAGLMVQEASGRPIGDHVMAMFTDGSSSTALAQADAKTPTAASAAPAKLVVSATAEPPPVTAAPQETVTKSQLSNPAVIAAGATAAAAGPVRAGDYLIFGGAGNSPASVPTASNNRAIPLTPTASANPSPDTASNRPGPSRNGDFLVFGSNGAPIPTTLPTGSGPAVGNAAMASEVSADDAATPHLQAQLSSSANGDQPRLRPVPARIGRSSPPAVLPMPTTGPGAIPGGHSQALSANGMGASANPLDTTTTTAGNNQSNQWFTGAFSQAMDKYQRASRLGGDGAQDMPPAAGASTDTTAAVFN